MTEDEKYTYDNAVLTARYWDSLADEAARKVETYRALAARHRERSWKIWRRAQKAT